jgi:glycerol-3-phosphate acyltransferase PlsX
MSDSAPAPGNSSPTIAVDALGGDHAPEVVVEGAVAHAREGGRGRLLLVGDRSLVLAELHRLHADPGAFPIVHAPERVGMGEAAATSVRRKPNSSIAICARLVKEGKAQAVVSAGNTGAAVAASLVRMRPLPAVDRPAIATYVPTDQGGCVLLDVGANSECKPHHLLQFAVMGAVYARTILGKPEPRIGLLNIGEESSKGNELMLAAYDLLRSGPLNFVGNVEGRDIFGGAADVVVCDGFTGNVVLKFSESVVELLTSRLRREIHRDVRSQLGGWMLKPAFQRFKREVDHAEYGGAPLLGVNGVCIIAHGSSSPKAIKNAIRVAGELVDHHLNDRIVAELKRLEPQVNAVSPSTADLIREDHA